MAEPQSLPDPQQERGASIMVSYAKLLEIQTYMVTINSKLDATLALKGTVEDHARRLVALETAGAVRSASLGVWKTILVYIGGMVTAALGGGALQILPKLWGG